MPAALGLYNPIVVRASAQYVNDALVNGAVVTANPAAGAAAILRVVAGKLVLEADVRPTPAMINSGVFRSGHFVAIRDDGKYVAIHHQGLGPAETIMSHVLVLREAAGAWSLALNESGIAAFGFGLAFDRPMLYIGQHAYTATSAGSRCTALTRAGTTPSTGGWPAPSPSRRRTLAASSARGAASWL